MSQIQVQLQNTIMLNLFRKTFTCYDSSRLEGLVRASSVKKFLYFHHL